MNPLFAGVSSLVMSTWQDDQLATWQPMLPGANSRVAGTPNGAPVQVPIIWQPRRLDLSGTGGTNTDSYSIMAHAQTSDVPGIVVGDWLLVRGVQHKITSVYPDPYGMTYLGLEKLKAGLSP